MAAVTIITGVVLQLLGIGAYFASGTQSLTALIPAMIGVLFELCGVLALKENLRKHAMHVAVLVALISLGASIGGLFSLPSLIGGEIVARPGAVISKSAMALIACIYLVLAIKSFVKARTSQA